jgi:alkanesulfonate monooxygenase SsuD/methylene tetrahydromethanopterin reductase-like flavin-dependent oxidoreductase (luciferase family)
MTRILEVAKECENLGYDSVWAYDHLTPYWLHSRQCLESWSLISAVAARTSKIKVGTLVANVNFRNPALLAKITSTIDNLSDGRLIVGLGIGDKMSLPELRSYGYRFLPLEQRLTLLRETIMVLKAMWTKSEVSFTGKTIQLSEAICEPKPKQKNGPSIWVGGRNPRLLDVIAEMANGWNYWDASERKVCELETHLYTKCEEFHRSADSITESWAGPVNLSTKGRVTLTERLKEELTSQIGEKTDYFIGSFPAKADRKAYVAFAEAVRSIA